MDRAKTDKVNVINISDINEDFYEGADPYSEIGIDRFRAWLEANRFSYYAAPGENFFLGEAIAKAIKEGNDTVVVENLS